MAPMKCPSPRALEEGPHRSVTLTHLAHRWHISRRQVRRMLQAGELPFVQVAGQIRVPADAARAFDFITNERK